MGVGNLVISLIAERLTTGEVQAHLLGGQELRRRGAPNTIFAIADRMLEGLAE